MKKDEVPNPYSLSEEFLGCLEQLPVNRDESTDDELESIEDEDAFFEQYGKLIVDDRDIFATRRRSSHRRLLLRKVNGLLRFASVTEVFKRELTFRVGRLYVDGIDEGRDRFIDLRLDDEYYFLMCLLRIDDKGFINIFDHVNEDPGYHDRRGYQLTSGEYLKNNAIHPGQTETRRLRALVKRWRQEHISLYRRPPLKMVI